MLLNLREIMGFPGKSVTFDCKPEMEEAVNGQLLEVKTPRTWGRVKNIAGIIDFQAEVTALLICQCARCLREFERPIHRNIAVTLSEGIATQDGEPEFFPITGDFANVDEIILTDFLLGLPQRFLCDDACRGLCPDCGADLNSGPCECAVSIDPRLAVLGQLLEEE